MQKISKDISIQDALMPLIGAGIGGGLGYGAYNLLSKDPTPMAGVSAGLAGAGLGAVGGYGLGQHEQFMEEMKKLYAALRASRQAALESRSNSKDTN